MKMTVAIPNRWRAVRARSGFTLIEMLVVIAIIGILAAVLVGAASHVRETSVKARVRAELTQIVTAIEAYHKKFGFYPPDNPGNPALPPLYYELTGNIDHQKLLTSVNAQNAELGVKGFVNGVADENGREVNLFPNLGVEDKGYKKIKSAPEVYALTIAVPGTGPNPNINTWRYVSRNPTNNTEGFDLWAEVVVGNKTLTIGNWKD
jgi:prepilin-type N-terminal cleavage/methylation domain-containing protein